MLLTNFSSGELSETLYGRVDLQQYFSAASKISNFEIIPTGGIKRRTGLKRIAELNGDCRLIPFIIDKDNSFILEIAAHHIYVWKNGQKLIGEDEQQYTINVPYASLAEVKELHYAQNYDTLILTHKNYKPYKLIYDAANNGFIAASIDFDLYPDVNLDDDYDFIIIATSELPAVIVTDGIPYVDGVPYKNGLYCILNSKIYKYDVENTKWVIFDSDPDTDMNLFNEKGKYPCTCTFFNNRLFFAGTENNPQKVWASAAPDTKGNRYFNFATYQKYVTVNKVVKDADIHLFTGDIKEENIDTTAGTTTIVNVTQDFTKEDVLQKPITDYYISNNYIPVGTKVISVTADTMTINCIVDLPEVEEEEETTTEDLEAQTFTIQLWKSSTAATADDYEYQVTSENITTADNSFNFELASQENDAIKFLASNKYLTIGTESAVWCSPSSITALNIIAENNGHYGSSELQALCIDTAVVFFAQGQYAIREFYYNAQSEAFQTNNIAIMAEQMLTESPAIDFDYLNNPYNKLIIVREDGKAVQLLYDKNNGIMGWNRIEAASKIKNCAVTRGDRQNDLIYFSVLDGNKYYLELLDSNNDVYLDDWKVYDGNLDGYNENTVLFNARTKKTCKANNIPSDFMQDGDYVCNGYIYESVIISMPVVNNSSNAQKRITDLIVRFSKSYMPVMEFTGLDSEYFSSVDELPYSGVAKINYPGTYERDVFFKIVAKDPLPVNILSVNANLA